MVKLVSEVKKGYRGECPSSKEKRPPGNLILDLTKPNASDYPLAQKHKISPKATFLWKKVKTRSWLTLPSISRLWWGQKLAVPAFPAKKPRHKTYFHQKWGQVDKVDSYNL